MSLLGGIFSVQMDYPAWCSEGRRSLIAGCLSLQRLVMVLPATRLAGVEPQTSASDMVVIVIITTSQYHCSY